MRDKEKIEKITNSHIKNIKRLSGGMIAEVYRVDLANGDSIVAKVAGANEATLHIEGQMLNYLNQYSDLPVPKVIHSEKALLIMTYIENSGGINRGVQEDAAYYLAALHNISAPKFGLEFDTLIGSLHQPNPQYDSWIDFFREQRLLYMAKVALDARQLPQNLYHRIERFAEKLDDLLIEPEQPSLIHGDIWGGNVLSIENRIAGFVDPAIYYAHPEIELAFSTLFGTFGQAFFDIYKTLRPIEANFFEVRRDIYNLYPLLVHVRLFGGGYASQVDSILRRFGIS